MLTNADFKIDKMPELLRPRPGHADLAGSLKYHQGIRPVLERASARETVMRVAVGALCKIFLQSFGVEVVSHVVQIGAAEFKESGALTADQIEAAHRRGKIAALMGIEGGHAIVLQESGKV